MNQNVRNAISCKSKNRIVGIFERFQENQEQFLICEMMDGNLNNETLEIVNVQNILEDVGGLLQEMHREGFVHLDVSPGKLIRKRSV